MPNRLADETSPYLLQHKDNPVDWYPWGPEAIDRARREDKPIFLSIGYSACHWCHVMEHESFEDPHIAGQLNDQFISIKVDREERPDLDQIYMNAVQIMTRHGGWPMSVFLTPDLKPFYGGTYWPPQARMGMPGFGQVLDAVSEAWRTRREQAVEQAEQLTRHLQQASAVPPSGGALSERLLHDAAASLERVFDWTNGGFGGAPKFPHTMDLEVLLRVWKRRPQGELLDMVRLSLDRMAAGGMYDHLGGGFARYSVDARWLVPHFEKMLYDNALLAGVYLNGFLAAGEPRYAQVVRETLDYVLRDMTDPLGGFYSAEDADSEGEEGKFYVWTPQEIDELLGPDRARTFAYVYDVTPEGNFEGHNILNLPKSIEQCAKLLSRDPDELQAELAESRRALLAARSRRVRPARDDKVLVSWNGLLIDAMVRAGTTLAEPRYIEAALKAAAFLVEHLRDPAGRLLHSWRQGRARFDAYLDDYACLANALVSVYEATFDERWLERAAELVDAMLDRFRDPQGGFYYTADDHEPLIARNKDFYDGAVPGGNSMAALVLLRLGKLTGRAEWLAAADATIRAAQGIIERAPMGAGQMLLALDLYLGPAPEIVIVGRPDSPQTAPVLAALRTRFLPNRILALRADPDRGSSLLAAAFAGKSQATLEPTVYLCENFACREPLVGTEQALAALERL